jgi:hypothetical protein
MLKLNPQCIRIKSGALGCVKFMRAPPPQQGTILEAENRSSPDIEPDSTFILEFPVSRIVRNKFLLSRNYSVSVLCTASKTD